MFKNKKAQLMAVTMPEIIFILATIVASVFTLMIVWGIRLLVIDIFNFTIPQSIVFGFAGLVFLARVFKFQLLRFIL